MFTPAPYPANWPNGAYSGPTDPGYFMTPGYAKDLVQVSIAIQINNGSINGTFTQTQFDQWYAATLGNPTVPFWMAGAALHALLSQNGVGTEAGPAGTFNK